MRQCFGAAGTHVHTGEEIAVKHGAVGLSVSVVDRGAGGSSKRHDQETINTFGCVTVGVRENELPAAAGQVQALQDSAEEEVSRRPLCCELVDVEVFLCLSFFMRAG